jgi:hypothetical protein
MKTLYLFVICLCITFADGGSISKVDQMPNMPDDYLLRDWKSVATGLDEIVFDLKREGEYLPLIWLDPRPNAFPEYETFAIAPYVGSFVKKPEQYDTITCLGAIVGASLTGIDKSNQNGKDWVSMIMNYYSPENGVYLNNVPGRTGETFWYEILPNILFYRVAYHYPNIEKMQPQFISVADRWYDAAAGMDRGRKLGRYRVDRVYGLCEDR